MNENKLSLLNVKKYIIHIFLWTPFLITIAFTIESLYFLSMHFKEVFLIPDFYVLELIFFTFMIPVVHWHKNKWSNLNLMHKRIFSFFAIIGVLNILKYAFVFVFLAIELVVN